MSCPRCGGWLKKKSYIRKSELDKGFEEVFECQRCGYRLSGKEKFGNS